MTRAELQRGRFLAVAAVVVALALTAGGAQADFEKQWLDCFESYVDSDALRAIWTVEGPVSATLDLECDTYDTCPNPWCGTHNTEGSDWEPGGFQYMRINYLVETVAGRMVVDPPQDWSDMDSVSFYYRGRYSFINGPATLQLQLEGNGAATFYGPEIVAASQCNYEMGMQECPWIEYRAYVGDWPGIHAVRQIDIVVKDATMNGRMYIDCVHRVIPGPTPVEPATWGQIKSLYR